MSEAMCFLPGLLERMHDLTCRLLDLVHYLHAVLICQCEVMICLFGQLEHLHLVMHCLPDLTDHRPDPVCHLPDLLHCLSEMMIWLHDLLNYVLALMSCLPPPAVEPSHCAAAAEHHLAEPVGSLHIPAPQNKTEQPACKFRGLRLEHGASLLQILNLQLSTHGMRSTYAAILAMLIVSGALDAARTCRKSRQQSQHQAHTLCTQLAKGL